MKLFTNLNSIRDKEKIQFWIFKTSRNEIYSVFRQKKIRNEVNYSAADETINFLSKTEIAEEFEPGRQRGKAVKVQISIPILSKLQ